jgi:apolipoprotein N-acyltransferase
MGRVGQLLLVTVSGVVFGLAFPKTGWWPLAFVALAPLILGMSRRGGIPPSLLGMSWGFGFFGLLLSWLYEFFRHYGQLGATLSVATLTVLVAYLSVYPGLFSHFGSLLLGRYGSRGMFLLPPLWVALEWIRGHALSGFPWGLAGYSLVPCLPLVQISAVTGVYGISFLVVLINAAGAAWLTRFPPRESSPLKISLLTAATAAAIAGFGGWQMSRPAGEGPETIVGLIQASIPQDEKWSPEAARAILDRHESLSEEAARRGARLILWPESSSPLPLSHPSAEEAGGAVVANRPYREDLESLARQSGASLLFGTVDYRTEGREVRPVNAAALVRPNGTWGPTYAKMHLVPFGEYVPLAPLLGFVNRFAQGAIGDFLSGSEPVVARVDGLTVGTCICYEMAFPELVRRFPLQGADVLANLTNDAWFGTSSGPYQHFQMAVLRAVENRRYLVRAANTGITAIVDPRGRVLARTALQETRVLTGTIRAIRGKTVYVRVGDVFAILCVILSASALAAGFMVARPFTGEGTIGH